LFTYVLTYLQLCEKYLCKPAASTEAASLEDFGLMALGSRMGGAGAIEPQNRSQSWYCFVLTEMIVCMDGLAVLQGD